MHLLSPLRRETRHCTGRGRQEASLILLPLPLPTNIVNRSPHLHLTLLPRHPTLKWQILTQITGLVGLLHCTKRLPSVGVKEGLSCVFSRAKWRGKARNLALP